MDNIGKILLKVVNLLIAAGWLWVFQSLEWITFTADHSLWEAIALTALVAWLVEVIFDIVYVTFVMVTCGFGCITLPLVMIGQGWLFLIAASRLTNWFDINVEFLWIGLLMSIALGLVRIPAASVSTSTTEE